MSDAAAFIAHSDKGIGRPKHRQAYLAGSIHCLEPLAQITCLGSKIGQGAEDALPHHGHKIVPCYFSGPSEDMKMPI